VQTLERSVDVSKGVDPLGVLNVTMPIILIRLRQPFHVTSMGHHWLRSKMKFAFSRPGQGTISVPLFNVQTVKARTYVAKI